MQNIQISVITTLNSNRNISIKLLSMYYGSIKSLCIDSIRLLAIGPFPAIRPSPSVSLNSGVKIVLIYCPRPLCRTKLTTWTPFRLGQKYEIWGNLFKGNIHFSKVRCQTIMLNEPRTVHQSAVG